MFHLCVHFISDRKYVRMGGRSSLRMRIGRESHVQKLAVGGSSEPQGGKQEKLTGAGVHLIYTCEIVRLTDFSELDTS